MTNTPNLTDKMPREAVRLERALKLETDLQTCPGIPGVT